MVWTGCNRSFRIASAKLRTFVVILFWTVSCRAGSQDALPTAAQTRSVEEKPLIASALNPVVALPWVKAEGIAPFFNAGTLTGAGASPIKEVKKPGVNWTGVLLQSGLFLTIEQGFRAATQPGTRDALKGPFFDDWFKSVKSTKGWGDGDNFLTNYIGHPMQGSVSGYIFVQNDPNGRDRVFSRDPWYWNSRLKATAWSAMYSTQFEFGPMSEASLGNVGHHDSSLSGAVDLVVTPLAGLGWQIGEDAIDKYLVMRIESWTRNPVVLLFARSFLNPTRTFANAMRLKAPWSRDTRPGLWEHSAERR